MDRVWVELVGPMVAVERRRQAERERVLASVDGGDGRGRSLVFAAGRLLVRVGCRLETVGAARPAMRSFVVVADPCRGCAT